MSSLNKITFRIIGVFALAAGIIYFSINVLELGELTAVKDFLIQYISLMINCVAIYGGLQLLRLNEIGRRLLIIWLCCQVLITVFVVFGLTLSSIFSGNFQVNVPTQIPNALIISFYLICIMAFIYLLINKVSTDLSAEKSRHWHVVATLLSLLTPGLGRALGGNLFIGMILFYIYGLLMTATVSFNSNPAYLNSVGQFLYYLVVWKIFSSIDWSTVKGFEKSEQRTLDNAPDLTPGQVNGG